MEAKANTFNLSNPIVIDVGSGKIKTGFSGEDAPRHVIPAVVGRPVYRAVLSAPNQRKIHVGNKALSRKAILKINYPIVNGIIRHWDEMEQIFGYTFYDEMRIDPRQHPVLITEAPLNPKVNRQKLTEVLFERFDIPALHMAIQGVLSLYAAGKTTGVALDIGDGVSHTVPSFDGYALTHSIDRIDLAGRDLTDWMSQLLLKSGYSLRTANELEIVRNIKEKVCYVAANFEQELEASRTWKAVQMQYQLPDGNVINVGTERFCCPEMLFSPSMMGSKERSIVQLFYDTIMKCDINIRKILYANTVISGGTTTCPGMDLRLEKELYAVAPHGVQVGITSQCQRKYAVWVGGSILSALPQFHTMWVSKRDYHEFGSSIIHRICY